MEPLFPDVPPMEPLAPHVAAHLEAARRRQRDLIASGDTAASGGRGRTRSHLEADQEVWSSHKLRERAQKEIQRQLAHKDPKIRRDAAKAALEMADGKFSDGSKERAVVYLTAALDDGPQDVDELERLAAAAEKEALERYIGVTA